MSIIHEALKKVQKANGQDQQPAPAGEKKSKVITYVLYIAVFCLGGLLAKVSFDAVTSLFLSRQRATQPTGISTAARPAKINKGVADKITTAEPKALPFFNKASKKAPAFVLNGVFFSEGEGYALVNNKILKEGDTIEGATVVKVALEEVELSLDGQPIKLYTYAH